MSFYVLLNWDSTPEPLFNDLFFCHRLFPKKRLFLGRFIEKTTAEWLERFEGASFPYGPINDMAEVFEDPQVVFV